MHRLTCWETDRQRARQTERNSVIERKGWGNLKSEREEREGGKKEKKRK